MRSRVHEIPLDKEESFFLIEVLAQSEAALDALKNTISCLENDRIDMAYQKQYGEGRCSIVRPANVYGSYDNFDLDSAMVIPSLIRKAFSNNVLEVWGDGSSIRDFIHARDVARGMLFAVKNKITEPINLGSGEEITIKRIAEAVASKADVKIAWDTTKPKGDPRRVFDMSRAKSYGFEPEISIEDGINETIEWYLQNKEIADVGKDVFKNLNEFKK